MPGQDEPNELLVRYYLTALNNGQFFDALNAFSMDARLRDELGRERQGIREIAASFARREEPVRVEIEDLQHEGDAVAVRVRMISSSNQAPKVYRSVFRINRDRIHSLVIEPVPTARRRKTRLASSSA